MRVEFKILRSSLSSWDELFQQAADFATELGEIRVINISHSCDGSNGTVTIWYWSES